MKQRRYNRLMHARSKWGKLGDRLAELPVGGSFSLPAPQENPFAYARAIRNGLNGIMSCRLVRRSVTVSADRHSIMVRKLGYWPTIV